MVLILSTYFLEKVILVKDVKNGKKTSLLLLRIKETPINRELFYDYKKELQRAISMYSIQYNFKVSNNLVKLLALVQTPKAWSVFLL